MKKIGKNILWLTKKNRYGLMNILELIDNGNDSKEQKILVVADLSQSRSVRLGTPCVYIGFNRGLTELFGRVFF